MARPTQITLCSFCGKSHAEVKKLIQGPGVYICDNCVLVCKNVLDKELRAETTKKTPFLGDVPLLGRAFKATTTGKVHAELLILITPYIVTGDELVTGKERAGDKPFMAYTDYGGIAAGENVKARLDRASH